MDNTINVHISVVSPVYGCSTALIELYYRLTKTLKLITENYEIIFVNDSSPDDAWERIKDLCLKDKKVVGINLSRNFGQHYAITAGLHYAKGDWCVIMDCDLQDQPEEIVKLYNKALKGYDIVYARRVERKDALLKKLSSGVFHPIYSYLSGVNTDSTIANFGIFSKNCISEFNRMKETSRSFPSLVQYLGFKRSTVDVQHGKRQNGNSSYTFSKLIHLSGDVILSNSNKPLKITVLLGFSISLMSFLLALYNVFAYYLGIIKVEGFTSTIFSIWFVGGLILFVLGIIGLYIGKIFDQVKERQLYIIRDTINL